MKRLLVTLDDDVYEDLRRLAFEKGVPMAKLVRFALDKTFEDDLDIIAGMRGLEEFARDPSSAMTLDDLLEKYKVELPHRRAPKGRARVRGAAGRGTTARRRSA